MKQLFTKKHLGTVLLALAMMVSAEGWGQMDIPNTSPVVENFNTMGTNTTDALPVSWRFHRSDAPSYDSGTRNLGLQASSGTPTTGSGYNWGSDATDRSPGVMTSGSYASPSSIMGFFRNTNASDLISLSVSYDVERYRRNTADASVQFFYSTDGSIWTALTSGDVAAADLPTGASAYSFSPPELVYSKPAFSLTFPTPIANNGTFYLRWNLITTGANSQGIGIDNVSLTATFAASTPTITLSTSSLTGFTYVQGAGPSTEQTFTISGSNLTNDISIAASENYEISLTSNSGYTSPIVLEQSAGIVASTTIYVRLKAGLSAGSYNIEEINASSTGATEKTVTCSGNVIGQYVWNQTGSADFNTAANWIPNRNAPAATDILLFNNGSTTTATGLTTQTIGGLLISNSTKVTLNSIDPVVLSIANGLVGFDFIIENGSELNINQNSSNAISIVLTSGSTGEVSGAMSFSSTATNTPNNILPTDANSLFFRNGSILHQSTNNSGSIFGSTGTANAVVFESGSTFIQGAGANPFGLSQPNSRVVFNTGSLFKINASIAPTFNGRTYGNFEYDFNGTASPTATSSVSIDNLTITQGTFNFNVTATPGHSIKGNIEVLSGASLNFNPASAGTVNINGSTVQTLFGGGMITSNATNSTININNAAGVVLNNNANLSGNLTISAGSLTVNTEKQLTVSGTLTNSGTLTIKSDATGTGSLIHNTTGVNATFERFMSDADWSNWQDGWHFLGSPVASQAISPAFTADPYDFYLWNEPTNEWVNFKNQSTNVPPENAPYFDLVNGSNNFELGRGYMVAYDAGGLKSFTGALNVDNVSRTGLGISGGANNSWHLLGNPFSSALTWDATAAWALINIAGVAKIWNEINQSYTDLTSSPASVIPATNGFMVQVSEGTGSLTIPAEKRIHSSQAFYKSTVSGMMLTARSHSAGNAQEAWIIVNPNATEGYDMMYDSEFLAGHAPKFYSVAGELMLSTNSLPALTDETEIPFGFVKNAGSQFSIEVSGIESISTSIYLTDLKTNTVHKLSENPIYTFTSAEGDNPNRFLLHFGVVGIDEKNPVETLQAYAYNNRLFVNNSLEKASLSVYDLQGRLLLQRQINESGLQSVELKMPAGVYIVRLHNSLQSKSVKIIVQ